MTALGVAILLILSAVGSLLWAMPNKLEQRQAQMRTKAMSLGLSLTTLNISDQSERGRVHQSRRLVTGYRLRCPATVLRHWPECLILRTTSGGHYGLPEQWCWADQPVALTPQQRQLLNQYLQNLPAWIEAWGITPEGVVAVIEERQGDARIDELKIILRQWIEQIESVAVTANSKR
jgi:hypothetical protein